MAHSEACQLFIEQQIDEGLQEGKTPYLIGKDLSVWIEKLFEAKIPPRTLEQRARRIAEKDATNVANHPTIQEHSRIEENFVDRTSRIPGGVGRPPKFKTNEETGAIEVVHEPNRTQFTGENEWYTPVEYVRAASECMGGIDLDPASSIQAQSRINAARYFTKGDGALVHPWSGRVWLNPPYSQPLIFQFVQKLVSEFKSGNIFESIMLTHNYTDTAWFHLAESACSCICFTRGRIKFEDMNGRTCQPTQGQAFFYFGRNSDKFRSFFGRYGFIR